MVKNRLGLHLRAATAVAETLHDLKANVTLTRGKNRVDARSITGMMMLGAGRGAKISVRAEGHDAERAVQALKTLFDARFGEE